jgi:hypothetical protein
LHFRQKRVFPSVAGCFFSKKNVFSSISFSKKNETARCKTCKAISNRRFYVHSYQNRHACFRCKQNVGASAQDFKAIAVVLLKRKNPPLPEGRGG